MKHCMRLFLVLLTFFVMSCDKDDPSDIIIEEVLKTPQLKTHEVTDITVYSLKIGYKIMDEGASEITETGFVISTNTNPTIEKNFAKFSLPINESGEYLTHVKSLPEEITTYFIRAYAINKHGIGYGNEVQFSTLGNKTYHGEITLITQEEVIEFGTKNYNTITGGLYIKGSVKDLSPLKDLYEISSGFGVIGTSDLKNLKGLENLKTIGDIQVHGVTIRDNLSLTSFSGLKNLERTSGDFYIINNKNLETLLGMESLKIVGLGSFRIEDNPNLRDLNDLEKLEFIGDDLAVVNNASLVEISGLNNLNFVPNMVYIGENNSLTKITGLKSLKNINKLLLNQNSVLSNLDGIKTCESFNALLIDGNSSLKQLPVFENLKHIENIQIRYGGALENLSGLKNLTSIGTLDFYQSNIKSLEGMENLKSVNFLIKILLTNNLRDLKGLENIISIGNGDERTGLQIDSNEQLKDFNGLQGLTNVKGSVIIAANGSLANLNGLENLNSIEHTLHLAYNESLTNLDAIKNISELKGFALESNNRLEKLPDFNNLTTLDHIYFGVGGVLNNFQGFNNLHTVGSISLSAVNLSSFSGLDNLKKIARVLHIENCPNLYDLEGLSSLKTIGDGNSDNGLSINYNPHIKNFNGLNNLKDIDGNLEIRVNPSLQNLNGLEALTTLKKDVQIYGNVVLSDYCALSTLFTTNTFNGNYGVEHNLKNPAIQDIKDGNCN